MSVSDPDQNVWDAIGDPDYTDCSNAGEPRRNLCLACYEHRPEDCSVYGKES